MKQYTLSSRLTVAALGLNLLIIGCSTTGENGGSPQNEEVVLYIEIETTSDWTDLVFGEETSIIWGMVTWYSPSPTCGTSLNEEEVSLSQTLVEAQGGEEASLEAIVRVLLPTTDTFPVTIERGHLGATTVRLYRLDTSVAIPLGEATWEGLKPDEPENAPLL